MQTCCCASIKFGIQRRILIKSKKRNCRPNGPCKELLLTVMIVAVIIYLAIMIFFYFFLVESEGENVKKKRQGGVCRLVRRCVGEGRQQK